MSLKLAALALVASTAQAIGTVDPPVPENKPVPHAIEVAPVALCPDNSEYTPEGCISSFVEESKLDCLLPYKLADGNICVAKTYGGSSISCPSGMYLEGSRCVTEDIVPVDVTCKQGELTKDGCLVRAEPIVIPDEIYPANYQCPAGFKLDGENCISETFSTATKVCLEGYELRLGKCYALETVPLECPEGYVYTNGSCLAIEITTPVDECPPHSTTDEEGKCLVRIDTTPVLVCEKGYELNGKKCEANVLIQAILQTSKNPTEVPVDCTKGFVDEHGNCFQKHQTTPVPVCDAEFELSGNKCITYVPVESRRVCTKEFELTKTDECIRSLKTKPYCPKGYKMAKDSCERIIKEDAVHACPEGSALDKNKCVVVETTEPFANCRKGFELVGGDCVRPGYVKAGKDKIYKPITSCPKDYQYQIKSGACLKVTHTVPVTNCEKGYTQERNRCVAHHSTEPVLTCSKGYTLNETEKTCHKQAYDRPVFVCPEGSEDYGEKCYIYSGEHKKKM